MKKLILAILILTITATVINAEIVEDIDNATADLRQSFDKLGIDVVMNDIVSQMNAQTPMSLGKASILEFFKYSDKALISKIIVDKKATKIVKSNQGDIFKSKTRAASIDYVCNTVENRMFLNNGITIRHNYYSENNKFLYSNVFSKNDCPTR